MFKVNNKNIRTMSSTSCFAPYSNVSNVNFEQVNINWVSSPNKSLRRD